MRPLQTVQLCPPTERFVVHKLHIELTTYVATFKIEILVSCWFSVKP